MAQPGHNVLQMPWGGSVELPGRLARGGALRRGTELLADVEALPEPTAGELALPARRWVEWIAQGSSSGATTFLDGLLRRAREAGHFSALIDPAATLDPASLSPSAAEALLWVRCPDLPKALRALDIVLRDPNFAFVAADFRAVTLKGVAATSWYRLQRLVHQREGTFLSLTDRPLAPSADARYEIRSQWSLADLATRRQALHAQAAGRFHAAESPDSSIPAPVVAVG